MESSPSEIDQDSTSTISLPDNTTASSSDTPAKFTSSLKFDFSNASEIAALEAKIKKNSYIKEDIVTTDDAIIFEELRESKRLIPEKMYPNLYRWAKEMERMRRNWRVSKRKEKGRTFVEFINKEEEKLRKQKKLDEEIELIQGLKITDNIYSNHSSQSQTNTFSKTASKIPLKIPDFSPKNKKKLREFSLEIGIRFNESDYKNWVEISSNLSIMSQAYLPRGTEIRTVKDEKSEEIFVVISTFSHKEKYDITYIERDIKRNVPSVKSVEIICVKEVNDEEKKDNNNNNSQ